MNKSRLKRIIDLFFGSLLIIVSAPLMALIAVAIRSCMGRPVLFLQTRPGLNRVQFTIYKFRTMDSMTDGRGNLLPNEQRLTTLGRILRRTSLDELPELINVLKGDMSLVGPRPLRIEYLPHYTPRQARRHHVRPGITGLAQVNGRNSLTWERRLALDAYYAENWSLLLDFWILVRTPFVAIGLRRSNVADGYDSQPFVDPNQNERSDDSSGSRRSD